jgi:ribosomal protein S27E
MEYPYRCTVCGTELLVNEAVIDAGIGMAQFRNEYHEGFMPTIGCPGCNGDTMVYSDQD